MIIGEEEYLVHYGIKRKSGRYPWGSGNNTQQRSKSFLEVTNDMRKQGMSDPQIAKSFATKEYPFTTSDLRALRSIATTEIKQDQILTAKKLQDKGMGYSAIGRQMGVNESTVRSLLEEGRADRLDVLKSTAEMLKRQVEEKEYLDVGAQVERNLPLDPNNPAARAGISKDKFNTALSILKEEGYSVHTVKVRQVGTGEMTTFRVLSKQPPTREGQKQVFLNRDKIGQINEHSNDGGNTYLGIKPPLSISSKRVGIKYKEDGGANADGVIYVRPGVKDVELGGARYAQVRIMIDNSHYLKGMAVYKHDLPPGVDLQFNTNKSSTGNKLDAMKPLKRNENGKVDPDNPFGAVIKQGGQILDAKGTKATSAMNKLNEEGDWDKWSKNLSTQVLSKQAPELAKQQLAATYDRRKREFDEIKALTNPTVRKELLKTFGDETDSAAVHLKAAALPGQTTKVVLPSTHVKEHEIFAPTFKDGDRVALIRFPHAGTFEIPELTVNNRTPAVRRAFDEAKSLLDAVIIHPKVAEHLSGADFDGDTVLVIPNNRRSIQVKHPLDDLKGFDPRDSYPPHDGMKTIDGGTYNAKTKEVDYGRKADGTPNLPRAGGKGLQMGNVTNLISDMTIKGANDHEIARAVKHSMVVIDSEKHVLDYKRSERENGITELKRRYQGITGTGQLKGASTLITRATSQEHVLRRKARPAADGGAINKTTGEKEYVPTGERRKDGSLATQRSTKLAEAKDARKLLSDHGGQPIEKVYAEHSNKLKALANEARLEQVHTKPIPYSPSAKKTYANEVSTLNAQLNVALKNAPLERQAHILAGQVVAQKRKANPEMDRADEKKIRGQALTEARLRTGSAKTRIKITPREWEAIQAGAISHSKLETILKNSNMEDIRKHATPRIKPVMTTAVTARAKAMLRNGASLREVADALGIPLSTLKDGVKEGGD